MPQLNFCIRNKPSKPPSIKPKLKHFVLFVFYAIIITCTKSTNRIFGFCIFCFYGLRWNAYDGDIFTPVDIDSTDTASWLQIWNGGQGGIYNFAFYWPALEDGEVYLRCFEVTENIELSKDRMKPRTTTQVSNHTGFGQIVEPNHKYFTIYEGDWEDYYAARIEVWHRNASTGEETKLLEKIYRVEGWMR